jgi:hypothetical protein
LAPDFPEGHRCEQIEKNILLILDIPKRPEVREIPFLLFLLQAINSVFTKFVLLSNFA